MGKAEHSEQPQSFTVSYSAATPTVTSGSDLKDAICSITKDRDQMIDDFTDSLRNNNDFGYSTEAMDHEMLDDIIQLNRHIKLLQDYVVTATLRKQKNG